MSKRRLGRGLDALLGGGGAVEAPTAVPEMPAAPAESTAQAGGSTHNTLRHIGIDQLQPGKYQPRTNMHNESLEDLASSIRAQGIVQPIVIRPIGDQRFEIIAGERRWRAAQLAELQEVPVIIKDIPDEAAIAMALIENIQREDLNPIEEAVAFQRLIEEFRMTHQQVADAVGRSRASVTNLLRLLGLEPDVRIMVEQGALEMGHARALLALTFPQQLSAARQISDKQMSVRETEELVKRLLAGEPATRAHAAPVVDPDIKRMETDLSEKLGAKVSFRHGNKGKGKLVIHYNSLDELDGILNHIQ